MDPLIGILNKQKQKIFAQAVMLQLHYVLVRPLQLNRIVVWENTYRRTYTQKLKSLQNRVMRIILGAHFRDLGNPCCKLLKILQIDNLFKFEVAKYVRGYINNITPNLAHNLDLHKTVNCSSRSTRQSAGGNNLHFPRYRPNKLQRRI